MSKPFFYLMFIHINTFYYKVLIIVRKFVRERDSSENPFAKRSKAKDCSE
jgi:hypothetical protein